MQEYVFDGIRKIWWITLLDTGQVSRIFQQKWQAHMYWVMFNEADVEGPIYGREACQGTQVVKIYNQNEIFWLIVAWEVAMKALRLIISRIITILIFY